MSNTIAYVDNQTLTNIANAVRTKTGTNGKMLLSEIPDKIRNIEGIVPSGSIEVTENGTYNVTNYANANVNIPPTIPTLQNKTITPSETAQHIVADSNYDGLSSVDVEAIQSNYVGTGVTRRTENDLSTLGNTVNVPSGYYAETESKSVQTGTAGIPIATKGTVNNNTITVTPSVTNTEGYIQGNTLTGNAITVSASELVSGTETITENGTYDVTTKASIIVNNPKQYTVDEIASGSQPSGSIIINTNTILPSAFRGRTGITSITSNDTIEIGNAAFENCTNLTSINFKNVITTNGGFKGCTSLVDVHMPKITNITQSLFQNCSSIVKLYLPSATSVAIWAVSGCTSLEELILPSCTSFGYYSWSQIEGDYALKDIVFGTNTIVRTEIKAFDKTNYAEGGEGGNIWITQTLYDHLGDGSNLDILTNAVWNTLNGYGTITWRQIEGSKYETYMPNGQKYNEEMGITE